MEKEALILESVSSQEAACAFVRVSDPEGLATPQSMAEAGECYRLTGRTGTVVFCQEFNAGKSWIVAAAGRGSHMTDCIWVAEEMARAMGCTVLGFQTGRRGLVRRALRLGYRITDTAGLGLKLEKRL